MADVWMSWCFIGIVLDITERKRLQEQERLYLYTVAHDLRAPVTIVNGQLSLLLDMLPEADVMMPYRGNIDAIRRSLLRMNRMIDDLTEITRLEEQPAHLSLQKVDLPSYLADILPDIPDLDRSQLRLNLPPDLPSVQVDPERLERIFTNLLLNAEKYSAPDTPFELTARRQGNTVVISVSDHGQGIQPDDLPHIFDRFYRSAQGRKAEGIGLGLYITKLLVEAHAEHIWVESEVGKGSTFSFTLPVATEGS